MEKSQKLIVTVSVVIIAVIVVIFFIAWIFSGIYEYQQYTDELKKSSIDAERRFCEATNPTNKNLCTLKWAKQRMELLK